MASSNRRNGPGRTAGTVVLAAASLVLACAPAMAQGWSWPWDSKPPRPAEPVYEGPPPANPYQSNPYYQPNPYQAPPPQGAYGNQGGYGGQGGYGNQGAPQPPPAVASNRPPICLQLEQRLAQEVNRSATGQNVLPKLEADLRQAEQAAHQAEVQLDRQSCYDSFLFVKTLRQSRACIDLSRDAENWKQKAAELDTQRQQLMSSSGRSYRDDIVRELARNNCGQSYQQEASRTSNPFSSVWQDEESTGTRGGQFGSLPFATYRTICVRLCDGFYFPVSFSTLPNHFDQDANVCQSKCAAPAELYFYQNPGASVEQAVSYRTNQNYTALRSAFRFKKEFIQGCSCKQAEYQPGPGAAPAERRADAQPAAAPPSTSRQGPPR